MSDENIFEELAETNRKLLDKAGGSIDAYFDLCHKIAVKARAQYAEEGEAWRGVGRRPGLRRPAPARGKRAKNAKKAKGVGA